VFSRCFAQPHPSGLKRDANTTGCSSLLADSLDTLSRGSSSFHCNHSANTRASAARTAANPQPPFVERLLFLHTRPPTLFRRADKALTRFLIRWSNQFCNQKLPGACHAATCAVPGARAGGRRARCWPAASGTQRLTNAPRCSYRLMSTRLGVRGTMSPRRRVVSICHCSAKIQRDFSLSADDSTSCRANPGIRCLGGAAFEQCFEGFSLPFDQRSDANDGVR
jgi:hypothetical protein